MPRHETAREIRARKAATDAADKLALKIRARAMQGKPMTMHDLTVETMIRSRYQGICYADTDRLGERRKQAMKDAQATLNLAYSRHPEIRGLVDTGSDDGR